MRSVAYVTTRFPTMAWFIENEVRLLLERGVKVRVFTLRSRQRHQPDHDPLLAVTRAVGNPLAPAAWGALVGWLLRRPRVLVGESMRLLWTSRGSLYALLGHIGYLPAAARIARAVEAEALDRVHGVWAHFPASVAYLAARLAERPFSMSGHAGGDLYRTQAFLAEKARAAEFVTACVRGNAEMLRSLAGPGARVECVYHGVDLRRFDGTGRARDAEPLLVAVGRLARTKGFDVAIRALGLLRGRGLEPRLCVVGEGPERARLESLARELGMRERVTLAGPLPQRELLPLYRRAWALVAPSVVLANGRRDGIPNVIIEAMAMAVPCVGTRAAGLEEAIVPGETGALCAPGDPQSLADEIEVLLRHPEELERMGANARLRVVQAFDAERNFERLEALFFGPRVDCARTARQATAG